MYANPSVDRSQARNDRPIVQVLSRLHDNPGADVIILDI